jgi:predicted amidophosphoribosyltransferase
MPLNVRCRAQYLTAPVANMRGIDYDAIHLVKAVKGLDLSSNSYAYVSISGQQVRITEANKDQAMDWFAEWAAEQAVSLSAGPKIFIPIPSSKSTPDTPANFRTAVIADKIAALCPDATAMPALRFKSPRPSSREEGGSRSADVLHGEMVLVRTLPQSDVILIDDVMTSGGHLKSAAWLVEDQGLSVTGAICCGRTAHTQLDNPFSVPPESIDLVRVIR